MFSFGLAFWILALSPFNPATLMTPPSFRWSLHAMIEVSRRRISREVVERVVHDAQQVIKIDARREIRQSIDEAGALVRVIIDTENDPIVIITAYRTSKVSKYWRPSP